MLEIQNLRAGYDRAEVLHDISFTAQTGKITAILGPNGCGKSTLLKTIGGILPVTSGHIILDHEDLRHLSQNQIAKRISYLAQNRQVPDITVGQLVLHGRFPYLSYPRRYRAEDLVIAKDAMTQLGIETLADTPLHNLSGGQRQKVYIAMALAQNTPWVLMDEPTTFLDISHQLQMMELARFLTDAGKTVIMVLHDLSLALRAADQVVLMKDGTIMATGTPEAVFESGKLEKIFGVKVRRVQTDTGWHYYF